MDQHTDKANCESRLWLLEVAISFTRACCRPSLPCQHVLEGSHTKTIRSCEWSPCGRLLATASFDMTTGIWERVADGFQFVASLEGHENEVKSASWSPSGSFLATCGRDKSVWIWEVAPGNEYDCAAVLNGHKGDVKMVCWHPHRELLLSASYDDSMKVWQEDDAGDDWLCAQTLGGHTSTVWAAAFDSSGDRLVSCRSGGGAGGQRDTVGG